jgi:biopolymer transport protein ExbD
VRIDFLGERVRQALLARQDKSVFIRADGAVTVQEMTAVWDKLKEGGVEKVGMMTKPVTR